MTPRTLALIGVAVLAACASPPSPPDAWRGGTLNAVLWMQHAAEFRACCGQTFACAAEALDQALADKNWKAAVEQKDDASKLPPAIVVDVDETVLDNSPYQARLLADDTSFHGATWNAWCEEANGGALPGAKSFLDYAAKRGVTVFYVTNRDAKGEAKTRENLQKLGFPLGDGSVDTVLTGGEYDRSASEKGPRRARAAATHRILLLLGDDLNDFVSGAREGTAEAREKLVAQYESHWGRKWFMLPNAMYGSWTRPLGREPHKFLRTEREAAPSAR